MIRAIIDIKELALLIPILRQANLKVAKEFNFTIQNAPTNPAFIDEKMFFERMKFKNHEYFGFFLKEKIIGCIALNLISDSTYGIERLAVLPEYWHNGYGRMLVEFVENHIKSRNGSKISIGIIIEHKTLLNWYIKLGFHLTGTKKFEHLPFTVGFMEKEI